MTDAPPSERDASHDDKAVRTALVVGPIVTCIGIAWTAIAPSTLSSAAILAGFAAAVWGTHRYGRQGLDA